MRIAEPWKCIHVVDSHSFKLMNLSTTQVHDVRSGKCHQVVINRHFPQNTILLQHVRFDSELIASAIHALPFFVDYRFPYFLHPIGDKFVHLLKSVVFLKDTPHSSFFLPIIMFRKIFLPKVFHTREKNVFISSKLVSDHQFKYLKTNPYQHWSMVVRIPLAPLHFCSKQIS